MKNWMLALLAVAVLVLGYVVRRDLIGQGELRQQIKAREAVIAALATQKAHVDTTYTTDTLRVTQWRVKYGTLRDSVPLTDTAAVHAVLLFADSTIRACSVALETCERRVAVRDSIIGQMDSLITVLGKIKPRRFGCVVGAAATPKGIGPGAACGLRF